jgi:putative drug exporter of the RND superfamily
MLAVYVVLVALLRQPAISAYLIVTVVFSYLVTIGVTFLVWRIKEGPDFAGLDWKVPIFTFTLLTALGEDYNILLMARVTEEQRKHGLIPGVLIALTRTGGIISSCGIIMAGTFCSLLFGTLGGMVQMGFALAFGVMLDTFVVRPILVPAYLLLLYSDRFGRFGWFLGKPTGLPPHTPIAEAMDDPDDPDSPREPESPYHPDAADTPSRGDKPLV